jgi:hypothetical protein
MSRLARMPGRRGWNRRVKKCPFTSLGPFTVLQ